MKRHPRLQDLSREHHDALQLALHARRAANAVDQARVQGVGDKCANAFALVLEPHFRVEETDWLPLLLAKGKVALAQRMQHDHSELRRLAARLRPACALDLLAFGALLTEHVRFEEREMFAALEKCLDAPGA